MLDIELYRGILGLPTPWTVHGVDLGVKLFFGTLHQSRSLPCPLLLTPHPLPLTYFPLTSL